MKYHSDWEKRADKGFVDLKETPECLLCARHRTGTGHVEKNTGLTPWMGVCIEMDSVSLSCLLALGKASISGLWSHDSTLSVTDR